MTIILDMLKKAEGWRDKPYYCSEGYPTIGYGFKIGDKGAPLPEFVLPKEVGEVWLAYNVSVVRTKLMKSIPWMADMSPLRRAVLISMAYQMGVEGLLKFKHTLMLLEEGKYGAAAIEMLDSRWAKQTPERAKHHAELMANDCGYV